MCGILFHKKTNLNKNLFIKNLKKLNHRGPDDSAYYFINDVAIGHNRLSIIDTSKKGQQPMFSKCNRYSITFNGEIYNFLSLRNKLKLKGYKFTSNSDTEVLLNGFIEYKLKILEKIDGIFAFVIYDSLLDEVFFARDQFGVKPLYYSKSNDELIISSETRIFNQTHEIDEKSKILFLSHGYIPSPNTIFNNVYSLLPGKYVVLKKDSFTISEYFSIVSEIENKKEVYNNNLLIEGIRKQLVSDAKIGTFFSGGIDSSIITYEANKLNKDLFSYSINFKDYDDEEVYQKTLISKYGINNISSQIGINEFKENLSTFIKSMDMPTIDGFNTYFISKLVSENNIKVALSGLGSDEIYYGYPSHKKSSILKFLKTIIKLIPLKILPNKFQKLDYLLLRSDYGVYLSQRGIFSINEISKILSISKLEIISYLNKNAPDLKEFDKLSFENKIGYYELSRYMEGQLLRNTDVFGMRNSIEIRVPFLDIFLFRNIMKVDPKIKINNRYNKQILINFYKNILPKKIYSRSKRGFELPYKKWLSIVKIKDQVIANYNLKSLKNSHWSKIWALYVLDKKY